MAVKFTNNARTTLAADITNSATTATVTSGAVFPELNAGEYFYCTFDNGTNNEIVKVTARSGNTLTIVRGVDNSTARAFVADDAAELRATAGLLTDIQENLAAKSANQTIYNATTASNATAYDIGIDPGQESNAMVFLNGVMQHHDTFSFSSSTLTFDTAPVNGTALEVIVDNLINLQSSNLTTDTFTATSGQTAFVLSDAPAAENNLIVFIDGVFQDQSNYSISDHTLTLATGAVQGRTVTIYIINPVNIGTPSDGTVTTSKLSGNITMPGTLTVGAFDVAFDSPTFFVDNSNSRVGLGTATPSVPVDIVGEVKISSHLNMPDNAIAKFGADADLKIYHNSNGNSIISEAGGGDLFIQATNVQIENAVGDNMIVANSDGAVNLYYAAAAKLATASGGVTVTGVLTATSLDISGDIDVDGTTNLDVVDIDGPTNISGAVTITAALVSNGGVIFNEGSDNVDFRVESNGNANMLFVDGGNDRVGIGTASPSAKLEINGDINIGTNAILSNGTLTVSAGSGAGYSTQISTAYSFPYVNTQIDAIAAASYSGQILFRTSSGGGSVSERMRISSAGSVGIGNNNPTAKLTIDNSISTTYSTSGYAATPANSMIYLNNTHGGSNTASLINFRTGSGDGVIGFVEGGGTNDADFVIQTDGGSNGVERLRITNSGNCGIGTASPSSKLQIIGGNSGIDQIHISTNLSDNTTKYAGIIMTMFTNNTAALIGAKAENGNTSLYYGSSGTDHRGITKHIWYTNTNYNATSGNTEKMRLDSAGRLYLGTTSTTPAFGTGTGIHLAPTGESMMSSVNNTTLFLNRTSNWGDVISFRQNGAVTGKISNSNTGGGSILVGNDNSGIMFRGDLTGTAFIPANPGGGVQVDNTLDIGHSAVRFDDIYATNGTIQTSDRNEKQDIAELTDAETRVAVAAKGLLRKFRWKDSVVEKGDEARTHFGIIAQDLQDAFTAEGLDAGDYAMFISTTWTNDDGEEQTRLGVRYPQLLAFIISAI